MSSRGSSSNSNSRHTKAIFLVTLSIVLFSQQFTGLYSAIASGDNRYDYSCIDPGYNNSSLPMQGLEKDFMALLGCVEITSDTSQTKSDWLHLCSGLEFTLVSSCYALVNSDNTLTLEGVRVLGCIRGALMLSGMQLPHDLDALQNLNVPTECEGTINWAQVGNVTNLRDILDAQFD